MLIEDAEVGLKDEYQYKDVLGRMTQHIRTVISGAQTLLDTEVRSYEDTPGRSLVHVTHTFTGGDSTRVKRTDVMQDAMGRILWSSEWVPDAQGELQEARTDYTYDSRGNLLTMTEPVAPVANAEGTTTSAARTNAFTYDPLGTRLTATLSDGAMVRFSPNAAGLVEQRTGPHPDDHWTFKYDHFGRLTERKLALGGQTWTVVYGPNVKDAKGNALLAGQVSQTDAAGYTTVATMNARGKILRQTADDAGASRSSSNKEVSEFGYDGASTREEKRTEGSSVATTTRKHDDRGRVTQEEEVWAKDSYGYEYATTSSWTRRKASITETYSSGPETRKRQSTVEMDSLGNVVARTLGANGTSVTDSWLYDAGGLLVREQLAGKPGRVHTYIEGLLTRSVYGETEMTSYSYYPDRRVQSVTYPSGRARTSYWNLRGLLDQETYGVGSDVQRTRYTYDGGGFVNGVIQGFLTSDQATRQYVNGPRGETLSVTLPGQVGSFTYGYDGAMRLVSLMPPEGSAIPAQTFDWDYLGRPAGRERGPSKWRMDWESGELTETNPEGDRAVRQYDGRGRVVHTQFRPGPTTANYTDLTEISNWLGGDDQPMQVDETRYSGGVGTSYEYDPVGRIQKTTRGSAEVSYKYTASSQRARVTSPSAVTTYGYDGLERLQTVTSTQGPSVTYEWEPGGEHLLSLQSGGLVERRCYDGKGRARQVVHASGDAPCSGSLPAGLVSGYAYEYDERGNRTSETYADGFRMPVTTWYGYDQADRLTGVVGPGSGATFYRIAGDGSRVGEKSVGIWVGAANTAYEDVSGASEIQYVLEQGALKGIVEGGSGTPLATFVNDQAGRVTLEQRPGITRRYRWDAGSRLAEVSVEVSGGTVTNRYQYDAQGLRRTKTGAVGVGYLWAGDELVEEQQAGSSAIAYSRGTDGTVVGLGGDRALHDGLGGVSGREGASPALYRVDAWGNLQVDAADSSHWSVPPSGGPSVGFGATHWDADAGLYYAQQRWYDPRTGRWLSEDPVFGDLRNPMSLNLWAYGNGNPLKYTDPEGKAVNLITAGIGAAIGAVGGCAMGAWNAETGHGRAGCGKGAAVGAGAGALAGLTFGIGTAILGTGGGAVAVSGMAAGGVGGSVGGAGNVLVNGGTVEQAENAALWGGVAGAAGGLVGGVVAPQIGGWVGSQTGSQLAGGLAGGAAAGLAGDVAAQGVLMAGGVQHDFSFAQLGLSTGLGMGLGGAYGFHAELDALGQSSATTFASGFTEGALEAELLLRAQSGFGPNFDPAAARVTQLSKPPLMLPGGGATTQSLAAVARMRGTGQQRGAAFNQYLQELYGGTREVHETTRLGSRFHDLQTPRTTLTDLRLEGKNYLRFRTVGGQTVAGRVPLSADIRSQVYKDVIWMRAGRASGVDRLVQWNFAAAPPSSDLAAFLEHWGLPYAY
jgi:RHS repeat-associated protein